MGLSGLAFTGYDIGGFVGNADEKLFCAVDGYRGVLSFFRGHSMINSRDSEPWSYGKGWRNLPNFMKLRYRLMPYLYSLLPETSQNGFADQSSLAIDFTFDDLVYDHRYHNQYLRAVNPGSASWKFKDLVSPSAGRRMVTLFTDQHHAGSREGGWLIGPMEQLPVFARGSILYRCASAGVNTRDYGDTLEVHSYIKECK